MPQADDIAVDDAVARALRIRRRWRIGLTIAAALLIASALLSQWIAPAVGSSWNGQACKIVTVADGATLRITAGGRDETVHLLGIDAPPPDGYFGGESQHFLAGRLPVGTAVTLKTDDPQTRDSAGRLLAYVYLNDSENLSATIAHNGMAYADRRTKCTMQSQIEQAEQFARSKKLGLWAGVTKPLMPAWRQQWLTDRHID